MKYNVGMISLGCEKNRVDAEMLLDRIKNKYNIISDLNAADAVIINTCGFIESSKEESIDEIFNMVKLKRKKNSRLKYVIATGCLAERYREKLSNEIPELDGVIGIGSNHNIEEILYNIFLNKKVKTFGCKGDLPLEGGRILTTPVYYAYLKIAEGCSNRCTYCAIPIIRGRFRSRKKENIIEEARKLVSKGVKEIVIIAQDTTRYGEDLYGKPELASLVKEICKIKGDFWIRLLYCYPERITDELIDVFTNENKVLKYIDLPLQHCSESILTSMNRKGSIESISKLISKMREKIPHIVIRTTFICGFPGETEDDFNKLCKFVKDIKFDKMGCFAYSREEGTLAFNMHSQINDSIKHYRCQTLMKIQEGIVKNKNKKMIGKILKVLVEGFDKISKFYFGRSERDAPDVDGKVLFDIENRNHISRKLNVGEFVFVKITNYNDYDLIGTYEYYT